MTNLSPMMKLIFERDEQLTLKRQGKPYCALTLLTAEIGLRSFAPTVAHDFVTLSQPPERDLQ